MCHTIPRNHALLLFLALLSPVSHAEHSASNPLIFGLLPSRSPVTLMTQFSPLREYVSQQLDRDIVLETAQDYPSFLLNTNNRKYDFVLTAPHFALIATDSDKYNAPVTYTKTLMADILVLQHSSIIKTSQLARKKISIPPESAIISMAGKYFLNKQGLSSSHAPLYVVTKSHNASIHAMLAGDTAAAIASVNMTSQFMKKKAPIRKLASTGDLPGMAVLVARDLPKQLQVSFTRSLVQMAENNEGKTTLKKIGVPGYRKTKSNEFKVARPYLKMYNGSPKTSRD